MIAASRNCNRKTKKNLIKFFTFNIVTKSAKSPDCEKLTRGAQDAQSARGCVCVCVLELKRIRRSMRMFQYVSSISSLRRDSRIVNKTKLLRCHKSTICFSINDNAQTSTSINNQGFLATGRCPVSLARNYSGDCITILSIKSRPGQRDKRMYVYTAHLKQTRPGSVPRVSEQDPLKGQHRSGEPKMPPRRLFAADVNQTGKRAAAREGRRTSRGVEYSRRWGSVMGA